MSQVTQILAGWGVQNPGPIRFTININALNASVEWARCVCVWWTQRRRDGGEWCQVAARQTATHSQRAALAPAHHQRPPSRPVAAASECSPRGRRARGLGLAGQSWPSMPGRSRRLTVHTRRGWHTQHRPVTLARAPAKPTASSEHNCSSTVLTFLPRVLRQTMTHFQCRIYCLQHPQMVLGHLSKLVKSCMWLSKWCIRTWY